MRLKMFLGLLALVFAFSEAVRAQEAAAPTFPDVDLRGRLHLHYGHFNHGDDTTDTKLDNGFTVRRARLGAQGKLAQDWSFVLEYDFAENKVAATDVLLMGKIGPGTLKIGHYKVPMGLNELTSSNDITFVERASNVNCIADSRKLGVGYDYFSKMFGLQAMVYGRGMGDYPDKNADGRYGDMPIGVAGRLVVTPVTGDMLIHLGASAAYLTFSDDDDNMWKDTYVSYSDRPEARDLTGTRLIGTGDIDGVENTLKSGFELAFQYGPLSIEGEYLMVNVSRLDDKENASFAGYHVQASYVITGESRGYRNNAFRGVSPKNSYGALEVAVRYSSIDLNDEDAGFDGGKQDNLTFGLNYYANKNVRFMANYIMTKIEDVDGEEVESLSTFIARAQYSF